MLRIIALLALGAGAQAFLIAPVPPAVHKPNAPVMMAAASSGGNPFQDLMDGFGSFMDGLNKKPVICHVSPTLTPSRPRSDRHCLI